MPRKMNLSHVEGLNMTFNIQQFKEKAELYHKIAKTLVDFSEERGGHDLAKHYKSVENQPEKALPFIFGNHLLFENIAKDYQAEMSAKNLQSGDILIHITDGSKWKFLHYRPANTGKNTVRADYQGDDFPSKDKNFVRVRAWDNEKNDWKEGDYEEFLTSEFTKA